MLFAFAMCGVMRTDVTVEHLKNAEFAANLLNVDITNRNPNGFLLETTTETLTTDATYEIDARTVSIAVAYVTNDSDDTCSVLGRISASEYASITDKTQTGTGGPSSYFFSRLKTPTVSIWPLISSADVVTYTLNMLSFRQVQDFDIASGVTADMPFGVLDAYTYGLAARLATIYKPERAVGYDMQYESKFKLFAVQDQERVPLKMSPNFSRYRT